MAIIYAIQGILATTILGLGTSWFAFWRSNPNRTLPNIIHLGTGFVTNFFDTLGIGSFAPTTAFLRFKRLLPDDLLPGTLNLGHAIPSLTQGLIFVSIITVDPFLLCACIIASVTGAAIGAPIVSRFRIYTIRLVMGCALLISASFLLASLLGLTPTGGDAISLPPEKFAIAVFGSFVFGALMTAGIGNFAPSLILFSLLGLNPQAVFPIMAVGGGLVASVAGYQFMRAGRYSTPVALGLAIGGVPGVLIAAYVVRSLPLDVLRWIVVFVVIYAGLSMIYTALSQDKIAAQNVAE